VNLDLLLCEAWVIPTLHRVESKWAGILKHAV
jgi:hypothetical protein